MMQPINYSDHPIKSLEEAIKFCSSRAKWSGDVLLLLNNSTVPGMYTNGNTKAGTYFIVTMYLSNGLSYPYYMDIHVDEEAPPYIKNFEEEFVYVLAHELQHVTDLEKDARNGYDRYTDHELEVRAEKTAIKRLSSWRNRKVPL